MFYLDLPPALEVVFHHPLVLHCAHLTFKSYTYLEYVELYLVKNIGMDDVASIHLDIFAEKKTIGRACYAKVVQVILPLIDMANETRETGDTTPLFNELHLVEKPGADPQVEVDSRGSPKQGRLPSQSQSAAG